MRAIIVLAGGQSTRFGRDKALVEFGGKPLISHVLGRLQGLGDEYLVSVSRKHEIQEFRRILPSNTRIIQDTVDFKGPLAGFVSGLNECKSGLCFLTACDMPFVDPKVVEFLFKQITDYSAVVPKWRDGRLEPLHAVYDCEATRRAAREAVDHQASSMTGLVDHIARVRFVTVEEISTLNPNLDTFRNLNTPRDFGY